MARYKAKVRTEWTQQQAFDYLADFATISEWDPGITSSKCVEGPPLELGARFELDLELPFGSSTTLTYETIEVEAARKVVLRSEESAFTSLDTLTFEAAGGATLVVYDAELTLKGPLGLADRGLQIGFNRVAARAERGLMERLSKPPPSAGP